MILLDKNTLVKSFSGSKYSGFFSFNTSSKVDEGDIYSSILRIVRNAFVVTDAYCSSIVNELNEVLNKEYLLSVGFFFDGINGHGERILDFVSFDRIVLLRVYRDKAFEIELKENLLTNSIYFYQDGRNNDRADFRYAAMLNRKILSVALEKIVEDSGSDIIEWHSELPIEITKMGFPEHAALNYGRE